MLDAAYVDRFRHCHLRTLVSSEERRPSFPPSCRGAIPANFSSLKQHRLGEPRKLPLYFAINLHGISDLTVYSTCLRCVMFS